MLGTGLSFLWGMVPKVQQGGTEFEPQELGSPPPPPEILSRGLCPHYMAWRGCWLWLS